MYSAEDYKHVRQALQPPGLIWPRDDESDLARVHHAMAEEDARVDRGADKLVEEADPSTAMETLLDWARNLGIPDACNSDLDSMERTRSAVLAKWLDDGDQRPEAYEALARQLGYEIHIHEGFRPFRCGVNRCGQALCLPEKVYVRLITTPTEAPLEKFITGRSRCGYPLGWFRRKEDLECAINRKSHAHIQNVFRYGVEE